MIYVTNPNFNTLPAVKQPWLIKYQMLRYLMAYPKKIFSYLGPSMWFSNRINWIISKVQGKKKNLIIFLASVLAMLGSWFGTCSFFFIHIQFRTMWQAIQSSREAIVWPHGPAFIFSMYPLRWRGGGGAIELGQKSSFFLRTSCIDKRHDDLETL